MRVQVVKESSGFGYTSKIVNWLVEDPENSASILALTRGQVADIPLKIARNCHNLVDLSTGEMVSKLHGLLIPLDQVKIKYTEVIASTAKEISESISILQGTKKSKIKEVNNEDILNQLKKEK